METKTEPKKKKKSGLALCAYNVSSDRWDALKPPPRGHYGDLNLLSGGALAHRQGGYMFFFVLCVCWPGCSGGRMEILPSRHVEALSFMMLTLLCSLVPCMDGRPPVVASHVWCSLGVHHGQGREKRRLLHTECLVSKERPDVKMRYAYVKKWICVRRERKTQGRHTHTYKEVNASNFSDVLSGFFVLNNGESWVCMRFSCKFALAGCICATLRETLPPTA